MSHTPTLWHNPRCSKSRRALELLQEAGVEPQIRHYLKDPPDRAEIKSLLTALGTGPRALIRTGEDAYKALDLSAADTTDNALIDAMIAHPILIQRPILLSGEKAAIGRPPEDILTILDC